MSTPTSDQSTPSPPHSMAMTSERASEMASLFKMLGTTTRLKIWLYLCFTSRAVSVINICEALGMTSQLVSHHLKDLRANGLVESRSVSPFELYYPVTEKLELMVEMLVAARVSISMRPLKDV